LNYRHVACLGSAVSSVRDWHLCASRRCSLSAPSSRLAASGYLDSFLALATLGRILMIPYDNAINLGDRRCENGGAFSHSNSMSRLRFGCAGTSTRTSSRSRTLGTSPSATCMAP
jgi:hypothetical protein